MRTTERGEADRKQSWKFRADNKSRILDQYTTILIHTINMSEDTSAAGVSRKEKRAQRDAERANKFKKDKKKKPVPEEPEPVPREDGPDDQEPQKEMIPVVAPAASESKKRKRSEKDATAEGEQTEAKAAAPAPKKKRKAKAATADGEKAAPANQRFIVFVGNLPYSTTDDSLKEHFKSLQPFTLRHRTDPATKKSKGFAFLEFEGYDRMKTALKLYHHSYFDPEAPEGLKGVEPEPQPRSFGRGPKPKRPTGRKINVELTAGGGGGTDNRKEKIRVKNVRLEEQRERRIEFERKEKAREERKAGKQHGGDASAAKSGYKAGAAEVEGIHPSRLANLQ
jgi:nucleolar protein 6